MSEKPSLTDPTGQPPTGICQDCYDLWAKRPPRRRSRSIYCAHNQAGAVRQTSEQWLILQPISEGEFSTRLQDRIFMIETDPGWSDDNLPVWEYDHDPLVRINELLTWNGAIQFVAAETGLDKEVVTRVCTSGMPWPTVNMTFALKRIGQRYHYLILKPEQVKYLHQLFVEPFDWPFARFREPNIMEREHTPEQELEYHVRLSALLDMSEEQIASLLAGAKQEAGGSETDAFYPAGAPTLHRAGKAFDPIPMEYVKKVAKQCGETHKVTLEVLVGLSKYLDRVARLLDWAYEEMRHEDASPQS